MKFYDFCIRQKGTAPRTLKLRLPLGTTLEEAMTNLYRTSEPCSSDDDDESFPLDSGLERFLNQIKCIQCNSVELLHFLLDDECTLEALESPTTPLTTKIIEVVLEEPSHASVLVSPDKEPKKQEDALKLLMTKAKPQPGCGNRHWLAAEWTFPIAVLKFGMNVVVYQDDYGNGAGNTDRYTWKEGGDVHFELDFGRVTLDDPLVENTMYAAHVNGNHYILLDK